MYMCTYFIWIHIIPYMGDGFIVFLVPECLAGYMPVEDQENLRPLAMDSTCKEIHAIFKHCNHCFVSPTWHSGLKRLWSHLSFPQAWSEFPSFNARHTVLIHTKKSNKSHSFVKHRQVDKAATIQPKQKIWPWIQTLALYSTLVKIKIAGKWTFIPQIWQYRFWHVLTPTLILHM